MAIDYIPVRLRYLDDWSMLTDEEVGQLVRAALVYTSRPSGGSPECTGAARYIWPSLKRDLDAAASRYKSKVAASKKAASARWDAEAAGDEKEGCIPPCPSGGTPELAADDNAIHNADACRRMQTHADASKRMQTHPENANACKRMQIQNQNQNQNQSSAAAEERACARGMAAEAVVELFYSIRRDLRRPAQVPASVLALAGAIGKTYSTEAIREVFQKSASGFLNGEGGRKWTATIGWLLNRENFDKVLSGAYDQPYATESPSRQTQNEIMTQRVQAGSAALGEFERAAIARMRQEYEKERERDVDSTSKGGHQ